MNVLLILLIVISEGGCCDCYWGCFWDGWVGDDGCFLGCFG